MYSRGVKPASFCQANQSPEIAKFAGYDDTDRGGLRCGWIHRFDLRRNRADTLG